MNDEALVQRLLRLLDRIGDRTEALRVYDAFKRRLQREFDVEPAAQTKLLIGDIRSRSARPVYVELGQSQPASTASADGGLTAPSDASESGSAAIGSSHATCPRVNWHRKLLQGTATAAAAIVIGGLIAWGVHGNARAVRLPYGRTEITVDRLAALDTSSASSSLGRALTSAVIEQLTQVPSFDVTASEHASLPRQRLQSDRSAAPHLRLTGSVDGSLQYVRVTVQLSDALSGRVLKSGTLDHAAGEQLALVDTLSRQLSSLVRTVAGHETRLREWSTAINSNRAYELMQQVDEDCDVASQLEQSGNFAATARALYAVDSPLAEVERIAPRWGDPMVERADMLERLGALYMTQPLRDSARMKALFERGISEADQALAVDSHNASALESLGTLLHWYRLAVPLPVDSAQRVLTRTERALKDAVAIDPNLPEAWSALSGVLYGRADYVGAFLAANRAYRADTYLENPHEILSALSLTSYEIHDDSASQRWCDELNRQITRSWVGACCELSVLARSNGHGTPADIIAQAWTLATDTAWSSAPEQRIEPHLEMLTAVVLARYGLRDSAEAVIARANAADRSDPEIVPTEAEARLLLHQNRAASLLLRKYFTNQPLQRLGVIRSRQFAGLSDLQQQLTSMKVPPAIR